MDRDALLRPTFFVDSDHPRVVALARELTDGVTSEAEKASRLFVAVRDRIRYDPYTLTLEPEHYRASHVLAQPAAFCIPKAVALCALARAAGLPARLGFADVKNHLASPKLLERLGTDLFAFHGYVELWVNGVPRKATPAFNAALCARFGVAPLEFDGSADALLQSFDGEGRRYMEYVAERGVYEDLPLDEIFQTFRDLYGGRKEPSAERDEAFHGLGRLYHGAMLVPPRPRAPGSSRRAFLRGLGALVAASAAPACTSTLDLPTYEAPAASSSGPATPAASMPGFFSDEERAWLAAIADVVLPPDDQPGGAHLGVVAYAEKMLTAFDAKGTPPIYAGGPYSGRQPFADGTTPPNDFAKFVELDRVTEKAMRLRLYGSSGVDGGGPNDAALKPIVGLRDQVKKALADAKAQGGDLAKLDDAGKRQAFFALPASEQRLFVDLVYEAAFACPEYGGDPNGDGWKMVHFEGDSQPLGYSVWDDAAGAYRERPEAPMSTPNPSEPEALDDEIHAFLAMVTGLGGGMVAP